MFILRFIEQQNAGNVTLNLGIWTKEKQLLSFPVYFKIFLTYLISAGLIYIICYVVWTIHLEFNHPLPFLGLLTLLFTLFTLTIALWFILPSELLKKEDFRRKLRILMVYQLWDILIIIQNDILAILFKILPPQIQFIVAFLIAGCREFDSRVRGKLVMKMMGEEDEKGLALKDIGVQVLYAYFVAVRMDEAESSTIFCVVVIDFVYHLNTTFRIIKEHRKIASEEMGNSLGKKNIYIEQLVLGELMEGFTPIIYGASMAMAFYGPNYYMIATVGNEFWGEKIEDLGNLFYPMLILFSFDTLSVVVTSIILWKVIKVNMVQETHEALSKYWGFIIIKIAQSAAPYFASNDVNFGLDGSLRFEWITFEGRQQLIYNSTYLSVEEKSLLLDNST